jgi:hypothetical protein
MSDPLFSIVMPVRDGEATFEWALESALQQDFDDFEIVILDNNSQDSTAQIVADHPDPRVRVFRNEDTLPMPENFEKAWGLARGEYVLYLCDDDALLPNALGRLAKIVHEEVPKLVSWEYAFYCHPDWHTDEEKNILRIVPESGAVVQESTKELSKLVYSFKEPRWAPRMQNCCVRRSVFETIRQRYGRMFMGPCPDYFFLALTLHSLDSITTIHRPLHIAGRSSGSVGAIQATTLGEEAERFLEESGGETALRAGPCGIPVLANFIAATLKNAGVLIAREGGRSPSIDLVECFGRAARNVMTIERYTNTVRGDLREALRQAAERVAGEAGEAVSDVLDKQARRRSVVTRVADGVIGRSRILSRLEVAVRFGGDPGFARRWFEIEDGISIRNNEVYVRGDAFGIHDILGMTAIVDRYFDNVAQPRNGAA